VEKVKGLTYVLLKIMGLYFLINLVRKGLLSGLYLLFSGQMPVMSKIGYLLSGFLFFLMIYLLLSKTSYLTEMINKELDKKYKDRLEIDYRRLYQILLSLTGVIILVISLPEMVRYILEIFTVYHISLFKELPRFIAKVLEIFLGLYLIFKSHSLSTILLEKY